MPLLHWSKKTKHRRSAIGKIKDFHKGFYSNLFLVSNEDGGLRPVSNLSSLHLYIKTKTIRMSSENGTSQTQRRGDLAATIDLKDAYLHVPIASEHWQCLRFWWRGSKFQFRRLQFSLSSAPRTFRQLIWPLVNPCRATGVRMVV